MYRNVSQGGDSISGYSTTEENVKEIGKTCPNPNLWSIRIFILFCSVHCSNCRRLSWRRLHDGKITHKHKRSIATISKAIVVIFVYFITNFFPFSNNSEWSVSKCILSEGFYDMVQPAATSADSNLFVFSRALHQYRCRTCDGQKFDQKVCKCNTHNAQCTYKRIFIAFSRLRLILRM